MWSPKFPLDNSWCILRPSSVVVLPLTWIGSLCSRQVQNRPLYPPLHTWENIPRPYRKHCAFTFAYLQILHPKVLTNSNWTEFKLVYIFHVETLEDLFVVLPLIHGDGNCYFITLNLLLDLQFEPLQLDYIVCQYEQFIQMGDCHQQIPTWLFDIQQMTNLAPPKALIDEEEIITVVPRLQRLFEPVQNVSSLHIRFVFHFIRNPPVDPCKFSPLKLNLEMPYLCPFGRSSNPWLNPKPSMDNGFMCKPH